MSTAQRNLIEQNIFMSPAKAAAIVNCLMPRNLPLPTDFALLSTVADLSFCPVKGAERRARVDAIAVMISEALVEAGR